MIDRILRLPEVMSAIGKRRTAIYADVDRGLLTVPVKLGARAIGWPESEIAAINAARIAGKTDDDLREVVRDLESRRVAKAA